MFKEEEQSGLQPVNLSDMQSRLAILWCHEVMIKTLGEHLIKTKSIPVKQLIMFNSRFEDLSRRFAGDVRSFATLVFAVPVYAVERPPDNASLAADSAPGIVDALFKTVDGRRFLCHFSGIGI
jgi:hypothetical protein